MASNETKWYECLARKLDEPVRKEFESDFWKKLDQRLAGRKTPFRNWSWFTRIVIRATLASVTVTGVFAVTRLSPAKRFVEKTKRTQRDPAARKRPR